METWKYLSRRFRFNEAEPGQSCLPLYPSLSPGSRQNGDRGKKRADECELETLLP